MIKKILSGIITYDFHWLMEHVVAEMRALDPDYDVRLAVEFDGSVWRLLYCPNMTGDCHKHEYEFDNFYYLVEALRALYRADFEAILTKQAGGEYEQSNVA